LEWSFALRAARQRAYVGAEGAEGGPGVRRYASIACRLSSVIRGLEVSEAPEVVKGWRPSPPLSAPRGGRRDEERGPVARNEDRLVDETT